MHATENVIELSKAFKETSVIPEVLIRGSSSLYIDPQIKTHSESMKFPQMLCYITVITLQRDISMDLDDCRLIMCIYWPLHSNHSFCKQIAHYRMGADDHEVGH